MARARAMPPAPAPVVVRTQTGTSGAERGALAPGFPGRPPSASGRPLFPPAPGVRVVWRGVWGQGGAAAPGPGRRARSSARAAPATPPRRGLYTPPSQPYRSTTTASPSPLLPLPHRELAARSSPRIAPATPVTALPLTALCLLGRAPSPPLSLPGTVLSDPPGIARPAIRSRIRALPPRIRPDLAEVGRGFL
ncbi:hypothetical protein PVAP13_9NG129400 [Panicum virgatum]|uniref:Uncharacterized protein n=1 Tax=Panicum virgatum TaxID=38727 RepID=A0A8T0MHX4_PANVG|nr:hypothetical protein PVAP13_9NG129400 [Panicum virgatum]